MENSNQDTNTPVDSSSAPNKHIPSFVVVNTEGMAPRVHKVIEDEFIDMSFFNDLTATPLTEDGGVVKYSDPSAAVNKEVSVDEDTNVQEKVKSLCPEPLARVRVRFEGRNQSGELLDKQRDRKQLKAFKLFASNSDMIFGIHYAVASLSAGEAAWFKFLPNYHYGVKGYPPLVPENATLYYKVELVDFTNEKKNLASDDYDGRLEVLKESRDKGNEAFAKKEYEKALKEYKKGLGILSNVPKKLVEIMTEEQKNAFKDFQIKLGNNCILACIKKKEFNEGLQFAENVFKIDPNNSKALFRKGQCLSELDYWDTATKIFRECMELDKESTKECERMIQECQRKKELKKKQEQKLYSKVISKLSEEEEKEEAERKLKEKMEKKKAREQANEGKSEDANKPKDPKKVNIEDLLQGAVIDTSGEERVKLDTSFVPK